MTYDLNIARVVSTYKYMGQPKSCEVTSIFKESKRVRLGIGRLSAKTQVNKENNKKIWFQYPKKYCTN